MNILIPDEDLKDIAVNLGKDVNRLNGKTILISGAMGFLGSVFVSFFQYLNKEWLYNPCKIIAVDNLIIGSKVHPSFNNDPNIEIILHDIIVPLKMKLKKGQDINFIVSCAGLAAPQAYLANPRACLDVSYLGTMNMCELAYERNSEAILNFSSSECYGTPPDNMIPTPEEFLGQVETMGNRSQYDQGKKILETIHFLFFKYHGVNTKVVRPFNNYSYVDQNDTRVLPNFIKSVLKREPLKVYGKNKENTRTFCFISDAITGFMKVLLLGDPGEVFNIGNDCPEVTIRRLAEIVKDVTNYDGNIEVIDYPENYPDSEPARRCPCLKKSRKILNYEPKISLEVGIEKFYKWAVDNYLY